MEAGRRGGWRDEQETGSEDHILWTKGLRVLPEGQGKPQNGFQQKKWSRFEIRPSLAVTWNVKIKDWSRKWGCSCNIYKTYFYPLWKNHSQAIYGPKIAFYTLYFVHKTITVGLLRVKQHQEKRKCKGTYCSPLPQPWRFSVSPLGVGEVMCLYRY